MQTVIITFCGTLLVVLSIFTSVSQAENVPDKITIGSLADLYSPVAFGHAQHIVRERDCAVCHHHTNGAPASDERCIRCHRGGHAVKSMGCQYCHEKEPFSAELVKQKFGSNSDFHQDKPGLKAAYHLSCSGCHEKKGGPVSCTACHELTRSGHALYRSGQYAPDPKRGAKGRH